MIQNCRDKQLRGEDNTRKGDVAGQQNSVDNTTVGIGQFSWLKTALWQEQVESTIPTFVKAQNNDADARGV